MEEESNGDLVLIDILWKQNNGKISVLVCRKPKLTDLQLHYCFQSHTSCKEIAVSSFFDRAYSIITNKDDLTKENAGIKQMLKDNGY